GRVLRLVVAGAIALVLVEAWLVRGIGVPVVVSSGSMAPALRGPHRSWTCASCGHPFNCDLESLPLGPTAVCPNCGADNPAEEGADHAGDRVLVDQTAYWWRQPGRWEMVVFRAPDETNELCVKRVVGVPGETIEIRGGEVFADGW